MSKYDRERALAALGGPGGFAPPLLAHRREALDGLTPRTMPRAEFDALPLRELTLRPPETAFGQRWRSLGTSYPFVSEYRATTPEEQAAHLGDTIFIVYPVAVEA